MRGGLWRRLPVGLLVAAAAAALLAVGSSAGESVSTSVRGRAVAAGLGHTCALTRAGAVKCWGYNGHDELGTGRGDSVNSSTPVGVLGLRAGVAAIAAGVRHSCAVTSVGGVRCWGANYSGALGDGTTDRRPGPVDVVGLSRGVTAVAAGHDHSCALTSAGGVECWGDNHVGELGDGTKVDRWAPVHVVGLSSGVAAIAAGTVHSCALTNAGAVKCWGASYGLTPLDISGLSAGVTAITGSCALTSVGGVKCWGGEHGSTAVDVPGLGRGVSAIATGGAHSCALTSAGGVKCWGSNQFGELGDGTTTERSTPVGVHGLSSGATAIGAAYFHTCAVTRSGGLRCWGLNSAGELGDGTTRTRLTPVPVVGFGAKAALALVTRSVRVTPAGIAPIRLRCGAGARCQGALRLWASVRGGLPLGTRRFSMPAGRRATVGVKLALRGFRLLVRTKRLPTRAQLRYRQPAGGETRATRNLTLIAPTAIKR